MSSVDGMLFTSTFIRLITSCLGSLGTSSSILGRTDAGEFIILTQARFRPFNPLAVYNVVDMALCGLAFKYFQSRMATENDRDNNEIKHVFYSRCIGCITGIAMTRLFFENPIHPLTALVLNVGVALASFLVTLSSSLEKNYSGHGQASDKADNHVWL